MMPLSASTLSIVRSTTSRTLLDLGVAVVVGVDRHGHDVTGHDVELAVEVHVEAAVHGFSPHCATVAWVVCSVLFVGVGDDDVDGCAVGPSLAIAPHLVRGLDAEPRRLGDVPPKDREVAVIVVMQDIARTPLTEDARLLRVI